MAVSKRLRYEVLRRDNFACRYCGATAPEAVLVVDAVVPEALGGSHKDPANLVTACDPCNNGKSATPPGADLVADVAQDALRWSRAMSAAAEQMLARDEEVTAAQKRFAEAWDGWTYGENKTPVPKDPGWRESVNSLLAAGLPMAILEECVGIAMRRKRVTPENTFRYMCGVAWKKVGELQARAGAEVGHAAGRNADSDEAANGPAVIAFCKQVLEEELSEDERSAYLLSAADYEEFGLGSPDDDPDRYPGALKSALNDYRVTLHCVYRTLDQALRALPDGIGDRAMKAARDQLYSRCGDNGFGREVFSRLALRCLNDEMRHAEAAEFLGALPAAQRSEWERFTREVWRGVSDITETGWIVRSAECARKGNEGWRWAGMCAARGETIRLCPERGVYSARIPELDCCQIPYPDDHPGHLLCERHMEIAMAGDLKSGSGTPLSVSDFDAAPDDVWADF